MIGCNRDLLRICSFIDANLWYRSSVTMGATISFGTIGCSTSTIVDEVYFFGKTYAATVATDPTTIVLSGRIHQYSRSIRFTSASDTSPLRTMVACPQSRSARLNLSLF